MVVGMSLRKPTNTRRSGIDDAGRLQRVTLNGQGLRSDLVQACVSASVSSSMTSITELKFTFADDRDASLWRSGIFRDGTQLAFEHWRGRIVGGARLREGRGGPQVEVTAPSLFVERLKGQTGARNWGHMSVNQWMRDRCGEVGMAHQIEPYIGYQDIVREAADRDSDGDPPSTWDVMRELAEEYDAWMFEHSARLIFARPRAIINEMPIRRQLHARWSGWDDYSDALTGMPEFTPGPQAEQRLKLNVVGRDVDGFCPGDTVIMSGRLNGGERALNANGTWLISDVDIPLSRTTPVGLSCVRPVKGAI